MNKQTKKFSKLIRLNNDIYMKKQKTHPKGP